MYTTQFNLNKKHESLAGDLGTRKYRAYKGEREPSKVIDDMKDVSIFIGSWRSRTNVIHSHELEWVHHSNRMKRLGSDS